MNKTEKIEFVKELSKNIQNKLIESIEAGKIPEEWDGIELRWLIADNVSIQHYYTKENSIYRKRRKEYDNTVMINNL